MKPSRHIDLLRHGATRSGNILRGRTDDPLSDEGYGQMRSAVAGQRWDRIVASPLSRCRLFAEELASAGAIPLELDERLMEYHFGDWDGRDIDEIRAADGERLQRFFDDPVNHGAPGGEDFQAFTERVQRAWTSVHDDPATGNTLVITHGGVILGILATVLGIDRLHGRIDVPYACMSRIARGGADYPARLLHHGPLNITG